MNRKVMLVTTDFWVAFWYCFTFFVLIVAFIIVTKYYEYSTEDPETDGQGFWWFLFKNWYK